MLARNGHEWPYFMKRAVKKPVRIFVTRITQTVRANKEGH